MGTNYYIKKDTCQECGHTPPSIHLGKSSQGWQFSFQYNDGQYYKNVEEMKEWTKDKIITDEYERVISWEEFWEMVDEKQKREGNMNHSDYIKLHHPSMMPNNVKIDGYSFTNNEFS